MYKQCYKNELVLNDSLNVLKNVDVLLELTVVGEHLSDFMYCSQDGDCMQRSTIKICNTIMKEKIRAKNII